MRYKINPKLNSSLKEYSDKVMWTCARKTLDMSIQVIPSDTRTMRVASSGFRGTGVVKINNGYEIGSDTFYASDVWNYDDANTNWTTPGTRNKWFLKTWNKNQKIIKQLAVKGTKLK